MKNRFLALLLIVLSLSSNALAAEKEITVAVRGMVCGFCAQGIQKKFSAQPAIDKVNVSLSDKQVKLTLKEGQDLSDETIKQILSDSGYNVDKVERN